MKKILAVLAFSALSVSPVFALNTFDLNRSLDLRAVKQAAADINVPLPAQPQSGNPAGTDPAAPVQRKEWTVMVFMNGSNNLVDYFLDDVVKMSAIGTTDSVNMVVEAGLKMDTTSLVQRMLLLPGDGREINSVVYNTWPNRDMGDWRNAADFVQWAKAKFPAKRYLLIIQDHGGGFVDETAKPKPANKGISYDAVTGNYIKVPELSLLLKAAGPVDMLILNACEMQMAEVAYEIGENAGVIIASEETDNAKYFQYKERLGYLNANPQESTEKIAAAFVDMRRKLLTPGNQFYSDVEKSTVTVRSNSANTLSAIRAAELKNLPAALDAWVNTVMAANEPDAILFAVASTVRFGVLKPSDQAFSQFTDLVSFANRVEYASKNQEVTDATSNLLAFLSQKLIIANGAVNINASDIDYSKTVKGISIKMIPLTPVNHSILYPTLDFVTDTRYDDLMLSKASQWNEFLNWAGKIYYQPR